MVRGIIPRTIILAVLPNLQDLYKDLHRRLPATHIFSNLEIYVCTTMSI